MSETRTLLTRYAVRIAWNQDLTLAGAALLCRFTGFYLKQSLALDDFTGFVGTIAVVRCLLTENSNESGHI